MSSGKKFSFEQDGTVHSVEDIAMEKVVQSGGAGEYAELKGKEARRKRRCQYENELEHSSSSSCPGTESRKTQNRMHKSTSTAAQKEKEKAVEEVHKSASVQEHSLKIVSHHLDTKREEFESRLSEAQRYRRRRN